MKWTIEQEKAIFVILAISKYFNALHEENYDSAFLTNQVGGADSPVLSHHRAYRSVYGGSIA